MKSALCAVVATIITPALAGAQSPPSDDGLPGPAHAIIAAFNKPLHPIIGGVAPSGGMGGGLGYTTPDDKLWFHDAEARVTINKYWMGRVETGRRTARSRIGAFAQVRNMNRLYFFGLGLDSRREDRSDFALRETSVGARGRLQLNRAVKVGGSAYFYSPDLGRGHAPAVPTIEDTFVAADIPGMNAAPNFGRYRGYVEFVNTYRGTYQVAIESVRDTSGGQYNFHRYETEIQQPIPGFRPGQRLTIHGLVAITNKGGVVPFYMQYALGGSGGLSAFRADTIGGDGTKATLRSFHDYRFRERDIVLMQAEYRIPLRKSIDATVFVDSGRVARTASDLLGSVKTGTGFSLSYMRKGAALARMDVGYGGEGIHFFWSFGGFLQ